MTETQSETLASSPDPYYEPVVKLEAKVLPTLEENETELLKLRAKSYRYVIDEEDGPQWKERGLGEVKILKHESKGTARIIMRRDKTLKLCINHYLLPSMVLEPHCSSEKAFVWKTPADFADEEPKQETLAIKFGNVDNAKKFKEIFEKYAKETEAVIGKTEKESGEDESKNLADELANLKVAADKASNEKSEKTINGHSATDSKEKEDEKKDILEGKESED
ncbi:ran-specific GTPase-activating protein-like [Rhopilema esculentum]|uniref:ran-specific GTPase-activating protein-like n=1 Tax=Rhopilema esculentum TaxID=499914 RepID=UPI0031DD8DCE|eukprot:gene15576-6845_t